MFNQFFLLHVIVNIYHKSTRLGREKHWYFQYLLLLASLAFVADTHTWMGFVAVPRCIFPLLDSLNREIVPGITSDPLCRVLYVTVISCFPDSVIGYHFSITGCTWLERLLLSCSVKSGGWETYMLKIISFYLKSILKVHKFVVLLYIHQCIETRRGRPRW